MKIVIDIPEDLYERIERRDGSLEKNRVCDKLMKAIDNGTPHTEPGEGVLCHTNLKENAELIARILDYDVKGEVYPQAVKGRKARI